MSVIAIDTEFSTYLFDTETMLYKRVPLGERVRDYLEIFQQMMTADYHEGVASPLDDEKWLPYDAVLIVERDGKPSLNIRYPGCTVGVVTSNIAEPCLKEAETLCQSNSTNTN